MARNSRESWSEYRQRMLRETSRFIEWGLKHPELVREMPVKRVGDGGFPRQAADWFWNAALPPRGDSRLRRWRNLLLHRPRLFRQPLGASRDSPPI